MINGCQTLSKSYKQFRNGKAETLRQRPYSGQNCICLRSTINCQISDFHLIYLKKKGRVGGEWLVEDEEREGAWPPQKHLALSMGDHKNFMAPRKLKKKKHRSCLSSSNNSFKCPLIVILVKKPKVSWKICHYIEQRDLQTSNLCILL